MPIIDPATGQPVIDHQMLVESQGNVLEVAGVPVF